MDKLSVDDFAQVLSLLCSASILNTDELAQKELTDLLLPDDEFKLPAAKEVTAFPQEQIRVWAHQHAVYTIPTKELVEFISNQINARPAIEIGAGVGWLGKELNITCTDNWQQQCDPTIVCSYDAMLQKRITYGDHVLKLEALEAVRTLSPEVVVGSWITEYGVSPGYGIKETEMFDLIDKYILVGNQKVHVGKSLFSASFRFSIIKEPWIVSRAMHPEFNFIAVWSK